MASVEGPNEIGKGSITDRVLAILALLSELDPNGFNAACVVEPPDLPIIFPNISTSNLEIEGRLKFSDIRSNLNKDYWALMQKSLKNNSPNSITWRSLLKHGKNAEILDSLSSSLSREAKFAEGFLTSRSILEHLMRESEDWNFIGSLSNSVSSRVKNLMLPERNITDRILIKDRGTASTDVFQGDSIEVQKLIKDMYLRGELIKEDATFVIIPSNNERWLNYRSRVKDLDIHDNSRLLQLEKYLDLRNRLGDVFSKNIIYLQNDPLGIDFHINQLPFLIALVLMIQRNQSSLNWYDENEGINSIDINLLHVVNAFETYRWSLDFPLSYTHHCFNAFYERLEPKYFYKGIPLLYYSGNIGIIYLGPRHTRVDNFGRTEVILAKDLQDYVVGNPNYY